MKKIITLFAFVGLVVLQGCTTNDDTDFIDHDTISEVFEVTKTFNSSNGFATTVALAPAIFNSDVVLVYHLFSDANGVDIWRPMPQTYYMSDGGALDYNFDFTTNRVSIFLGADFDLNTLSGVWTQDQTFRIVIVPGSFSKTLNTNSYSEVIKALNINESKIQKINF